MEEKKGVNLPDFEESDKESNKESEKETGEQSVENSEENNKNNKENNKETQIEKKETEKEQISEKSKEKDFEVPKPHGEQVNETNNKPETSKPIKPIEASEKPKQGKEEKKEEIPAPIKPEEKIAEAPVEETKKETHVKQPAEKPKGEKLSEEKAKMLDAIDQQSTDVSSKEDMKKVIGDIQKKIDSREEGKMNINGEGKVVPKKLQVSKPQKQKPQSKPAEQDDSGIKRVPTGIPGLDEQIEGGVIKNSVNLVAGGPGSGKSIFAIQFLYKGMVENNEPAVYISFEERGEDFYSYMMRFGWDLKKLEKEGKFSFINYTPEQVNKVMEEGGGLIESEIKKIGAKRIVIDSISAFVLLYEHELEKREALLKLFEMIERWGCTTILTAEQESEPRKHKPSVIEFEVDGVILLYNVRRKSIRQRVAEILKMRGTNFEPKIFPFTIDSNGIIFYPQETIY